MATQAVGRLKVTAIRGATLISSVRRPKPSLFLVTASAKPRAAVVVAVPLSCVARSADVFAKGQTAEGRVRPCSASLPTSPTPKPAPPTLAAWAVALTTGILASGAGEPKAGVDGAMDVRRISASVSAALVASKLSRAAAVSSLAVFCGTANGARLASRPAKNVV